MFDTYITKPQQPAYPQNVTVTEKRAPTDESVRLLREMEAKAEAQVVAKLTLGGPDNTFHATVLVRQEFGRPMDRVTVHYTLNGKKRSVDVVLDEPEMAGLMNGPNSHAGAWLNSLHVAIAADVAHAITLNVLSQYARQAP